MRDFFRDNARDRDFDDNHAEIINGIADNAEKILETNEETQETLLETLKDIRKKLKYLDRKVDSFINPPDEKTEQEDKKEVKDHIKGLNSDPDKDKNSLQPFPVFVKSKLADVVPNKVPPKVATPVIQEEEEEEPAEDEEAPNGGDE